MSRGVAIGRVFETLERNGLRARVEAMSAEGQSAASISRWLLSRGVSIGEQMLALALQVNDAGTWADLLDAPYVAPVDDLERVYYIRAGAFGLGPVKIGLSRLPLRRLAKLQVGNHDRLVLVATEVGDVAREAERHAQFARWRMGGEWFAPSHELWTFIASLRGRHGS